MNFSQGRMSSSLLVFMIRNTAKTEQTWWLAVIDLAVESEALWKIMQFHLMVVSFYLKTCGIINNYWTRLNKTSWFVRGETGKSWYLAKARPIIVLSFGHRVCFSHHSDRKKEKSVVSFTHEQNISCSQKLSQTHLDDIAQEQTIICRQLFADHLVGSRPIRKICFQW